MAEVIDLGVKQGLIEKSGSWYSYQGNKIGQGKANVGKFLTENPTIAEEVEATARAQLLPSPENNTEENSEE